MNTQNWSGCYDGSWRSAPLVAEAYAHPAKVSFNLAERIYRHMLAEEWIKPGMQILDPFGGVGCFAFHAALYGMHWTGVELEQRFVDLGQQNLELWRNRYAPHFPGYGTARLLQGDSRRLVEVVTGAGGVVSSPPFEGTLQNSVERSGLESFGKPSHVSKQNHNYGTTPGQLGNMPAGVVSSPPFEAQQSGGGIAVTGTPAQRKSAGISPVGYVNQGATDGQLAREDSDTFLSAAAQIVAQCYAILRPGGYAAWVTGNFKRNGEIVDFGGQWLSLCESVGFVPVMHAVAWKVDDHGTQTGIFGADKPLRREKVSFFRRLANAKDPSKAILSEDVWFVWKPGP